MTQEEKAKAYDEALERAKEWYDNPNSSSIGKGYIYAIFPELKESEDEKIRKAIITLIQSCDKGCYITISPSRIKEYTAWLEKQGEQEQTIDYPDSLPKDNWELVHEFVEKFGRIPKDEDELNALVEYILKRHNSAWNEKDESHLIHCVRLINNAEGCTVSEQENAIFWLKSLKDRVQPQATWKPSDEQMITLRHVISGCSYDIEPLVELETKLKEL